MMDIIYATGMNQDGDALLGGIWTLWHQEGFPLEMSHVTVQSMTGYKIDWAEAMYDASRTDNCPAFMNAVKEFLPEQALNHLKRGFVYSSGCGKSWEEFLESKRKNGADFVEHVALAARTFNEKNQNAHVN